MQLALSNASFIVETCGQSTTNSDSPILGVVVSPMGGARIQQDKCSSILPGLPSGAGVNFKTLSPLLDDGAVVTVSGRISVKVAAAGEAVHVNVPENGTITIRRTLDTQDQRPFGQFALLYTGKFGKCMYGSG